MSAMAFRSHHLAPVPEEQQNSLKTFMFGVPALNEEKYMKLC
jgi:hypothetical protein